MRLPTDQLDEQLLQAVRHAAWMRTMFYVVVLLVALTGQVTGAVQQPGIPLIVAIPAVGALELGGIVVMANADVRRRLGERALASRILSAGIAAGAVTFNWLAHDNHLLGGFYAGMSALGYLVWLIHAENQRRDRLRACGDLPPTTPAYELVGHWLRHPLLTRRARAMAKADPRLGLYDSLAAARTQIRRDRRDAAIAKILHRKIRSAVDPTTATIAVHVYDLGEIAARLAGTADYDGLTTLIAADLTPERIAASTGNSTRASHSTRLRRSKPSPPPEGRDLISAATVPGQRTEPGMGTHVAHVPQETNVGPNNTAPSPGASPPQSSQRLGNMPARCKGDPTRQRSPGRTAADMPVVVEETGDGDVDETHDLPRSPASEPDAAMRAPANTAAAVAYWLEVDPHMGFHEIATKIGRTERTVRRNLPPDFQRPPSS